jgi:hypothetical protein
MSFIRNLIGMRGAMSAHERRIVAMLDAAEMRMREVLGAEARSL